MATTRERRNPVRLFVRRLGLLGLFIFVCLALSGVWNIYLKNQESITLNNQAQAHLADLSQRQAELTTDIASLNTDRGREAALRQQYAMGHHGEGMIVIVEPRTPAPIEATTTTWQMWVKKIFSFW
jgi:cell division protein FtsB